MRFRGFDMNIGRPLTQSLFEDLVDPFGDILWPRVLRQLRLLFLGLQTLVHLFLAPAFNIDSLLRREAQRLHQLCWWGIDHRNGYRLLVAMQQHGVIAATERDQLFCFHVFALTSPGRRLRRPAEGRCCR